MFNGLWSTAVIVAYALWLLAAHVVCRTIGAMPLVERLCSRRRRQHNHVGSSSRRVGVIGGGIAGTAAAWSLKKSNKFGTVKLFESRGVLGGNAKTFVWDVRQPSNGAQASVRTGLSVLAWPAAYFKNYALLLEALRLPTVDVVPKFYVSADGGSTATFRQGADDGGNVRWALDQHRWDRAVAAIRRINRLCFVATSVVKRAAVRVGRMCRLVSTERAPPRSCRAGDGAERIAMPSMYEVTLLNPMNVVPARWFCRTVFGVSDDFWTHVVVPVYSSSFLTTELDLLPSVILPALDDIISVGHAEPLKVLHTWAGSSKDVFDAMGDAIGPENIVLGADIEHVVRRTVQHGRVQWCVRFQQHGKERPREEWFDDIVFACPATAVDALTNHDMNRKCYHRRDGPFRDALFEAIVPNVRYENERDGNFVNGCVHADGASAIPNEALRKDLVHHRYTNYIELHGDPARGDLENTFVLGTWVPAAVAATNKLGEMPSAEPQPDDAEGDAAGGSKHPKHKHRRRGHGKKHHAARNGDGSSSNGHSENVDSNGHNTMPEAADASPQRHAAVAPPTAVPSNTTVTDGVADMYVTYNATGAKREALHAKQLAAVDNSWAHPQFTMQSMGLSMALPLLQGRHSAYYCASYTTPGNGHDLSFLSGLAVAHALSGGYYPFDGVASAAAVKDFKLLKGLMFF